MRKNEQSKNPNNLFEVNIKKERKKWLCILNSVYISPYFALAHKEGKNFLNQLASNLHHASCGNNNAVLSDPPWSRTDFSEVFIGFTDGLHRFNDPLIIKALLNSLVNYILLKEQNKNKLTEDAINRMDVQLGNAINTLNRGSAKDVNLRKEENKGNNLIKKYWVSFFDMVFFDDGEISAALNLNTPSMNSVNLIEENSNELINIVSKSIEKYQNKALIWKENFLTELKKQGKSGLNINSYSWLEFRKLDEFYHEAKRFFKIWWEQNTFNIKDAIIEYCSSYAVGKYDENLNRVADQNYPSQLTPLSSALFVAEEIVCFIAKVLRDGPGIIIYPTPNLGGRKNQTPFTILKDLMQKDETFVNRMNERHHVNSDCSFLEYTYPNKKSKVISHNEAPVNSIANEKPQSDNNQECIDDLRQQVKELQKKVSEMSEQMTLLLQILDKSENNNTDNLYRMFPSSKKVMYFPVEMARNNSTQADPGSSRYSHD